MPSDRTCRLRVGLLGPIVVEGRDGALVEPPGTLAKALVVILALAPREVGGTVGVETIVDELWGDRTPRNAKAALQTLISRLRGVTAEALVVSHPGGYSLDIVADEVDLGVAAARRVPVEQDGPRTADAQVVAADVEVNERFAIERRRGLGAEERGQG